MPSRDIYGAQDGPKMTASSREEVIERARVRYPNLHVEASTGQMLTIWNGSEAVGSAWERRDRSWYYRLR